MTDNRYLISEGALEQLVALAELNAEWDILLEQGELLATAARGYERQRLVDDLYSAYLVLEPTLRPYRSKVPCVDAQMALLELRHALERGARCPAPDY